MPRYANPFNSPYPTDPAWGEIGSSLAGALFGDPELRAQQELRRAQLEEMAAQAQRARAAATYDTAKTRGVEGQNEVIYGEGPTSLSRVISEPLYLAAARAHPEGLTPQGVNTMQAGVYLNNLIKPRLPAQQSPLVAAVAPPAGEGTPGYVDDGGGIVVESNKPAPPPQMPVLDEQTLRLIGALQGDMPSETTAYTPEYGDSRQRRELASNEKRTKITADASVAGDRIRAGATVRSAQIGAGATINGQRLTDQRERGLGAFGPGRPASAAGARRLSSADTKDLRAELDNQFPIGTKLQGNDANIKTIVLRRASDLLASGEANSATEAIQRALQDHGVSYDPDRNVVKFRNNVPQPNVSNW